MAKQVPRTLLVIVIVFASLVAPTFASGTADRNCTSQQSVAVTAPTGLQLAAAEQGNPNVKVWVNTNSGVYHCPGTRWYGNTKSGEYMAQKQAQERGYRPAYGKVCQ